MRPEKRQKIDSAFHLTQKQEEARVLLSDEQRHTMLFGGSRSGKTFLLCRQIAVRALKTPGSRHVILRRHFNAVKTSIVLDTWPKMMSRCFPGVNYHIDKTYWFCQLPGGAEVWFGGLDDAERAEKILGKEFATIYLNEVSQIEFASREMARTRLAQECRMVNGKTLPLKMWYDCNPPSSAHWSYKLFVEHRDPVTRHELSDRAEYASMRLNPADNKDNLPASYLSELSSLSASMRRRFLDGEFGSATPGQLFLPETFDQHRHTSGNLPDFVRVVVAVDPSGSGDTDNEDNDAIGIAVVGLGTDGNAYLLEDCTVKAGPATWGRVATDAYERHEADVVVGEINYGGAMVEHVIQSARRRTNYKTVTATRGKQVRAEPVSALVEQGKVRLAGYFPELEDELSGFTTHGYVGIGSPNRADALVWAVTELFPGVIAGPRDKHADKRIKISPTISGASRRAGQFAGCGWMG